MSPHCYNCSASTPRTSLFCVCFSKEWAKFLSGSRHSERGFLIGEETQFSIMNFCIDLEMLVKIELKTRSYTYL